MQPNKWRAEDFTPAARIERRNRLLNKGLLPPFLLRLVVVLLRRRVERTCKGQARADLLNAINYAAMFGHARWDGRLDQMRKSVRRMIGHRA